MANQEQLDILLQGVKAWDQWRYAHLGVQPSLRGAHLSSYYLPEVDLSEADLSEADLRSANLSGADLRVANLRSANLSQADLSGADLRFANLSGADLSEADLRSANLSGATLSEANLNDVNISGVRYLDRKHEQRFRTWLYAHSIMHGKYQGIRVASCYGNAIFKRNAEDQDFLDTLENQWKGTWRICLFRAWGLIDYGRSLLATFVIAFLIVVGFGLIYLIPGIISYGKNHNTLFSPFYFSIVTFTTLGFGDVAPNGGIGEIIVSLQVILSYLTLGLLISIVANKVARRS